MKKIKVMSIFGTRPEVIKLAPVINKLSDSILFDSVLVTTGQHREMLGQTLDQFNIDPHYNIDLMVPGQSLTDITVDSLRGVEKLMGIEKPDLVLVQGDTTSAFAGCLAAYYQKTAAGHVEAGLRTYEKYQPFPEEINRSLITHLADIHFAPTATAWESLRREGIPSEKIFITGNTVIDSLYDVVRKDYDFANSELNQINNHACRLIVVTAHRRESFGKPLRDICSGISELVAQIPDIEVVFSVHRNPKVNIPVHTLLDGQERIHLVSPIDYIEMANLMARSYLVMTDSGGLQEEAPALGKPVLVLRNVTERPEATKAGLSRVIGTSKKAIVAAASQVLTDKRLYADMSRGISPYGDGYAAERIIDTIEYLYSLRADAPAPFISDPAATLSGDQFVYKQTGNEFFYRQLDEHIIKAWKERQMVSVATFNLDVNDKKVFNNVVKMITRDLREADTATTLDGNRIVLVMPGTGEKQAREASDRLINKISGSSELLKNSFNVDIKTYVNNKDEVADDVESEKPLIAGNGKNEAA